MTMIMMRRRRRKEEGLGKIFVGQRKKTPFF